MFFLANPTRNSEAISVFRWNGLILCLDRARFRPWEKANLENEFPYQIAPTPSPFLPFEGSKSGPNMIVFLRARGGGTLVSFFMDKTDSDCYKFENIKVGWSDLRFIVLLYVPWNCEEKEGNSCKSIFFVLLINVTRDIYKTCKEEKRARNENDERKTFRISQTVALSSLCQQDPRNQGSENKTFLYSFGISWVI